MDICLNIDFILKQMNMILVHVQGTPFNIIVVQVCAPTTNSEEADQFYEDLEELLELTPKIDVLLIIGDLMQKQ